MLSELSCVAAQYPADLQRFVELGLPAERGSATGSIKFDITIDNALREQAEQLRSSWGMSTRGVDRQHLGKTSWRSRLSLKSAKISLIPYW